MADNSIIIKEYGGQVRMEKAAAAAFTPGHLLEVTSADKLQKNSVALRGCPVIVALEDENQGNDIDDDYSANNNAVASVFKPGDEVQMWLTTWQTAVIGSKLVSNGDGTLKNLLGDSSGTIVEGIPIVEATEAVTTTTAAARIKVRVI